jgi:hypothetical protein
MLHIPHISPIEMHDGSGHGIAIQLRRQRFIVQPSDIPRFLDNLDNTLDAIGHTEDAE